LDSICFDSCHHDFMNPYDMNIQEKRKRLQERLEHNIKHENIGTTIAITGSWGVGKTYFWNKLLEDIRGNDSDNVLSKRKYAYISLFGIESLSDLKTSIYSNIENHHLPIEVPKWLKSLPSIFKDTRVTQLGINAPVKLIDNLLFNQVKDAIICFDDFERMSNKLDIKDVMGLANQLKLEKNCQLILILDESKAEGENKSKYAEYKEKLIDEEIKITSVEPLIRANTEDMDEPLIELMVKFANELEIHNFRFFQKVINLYRKFRAELLEVVAESTKEIILVRILEGVLIEDFSEKYSWSGLLKKENTKNYECLYKVNSIFRRDILREDFFLWFSQNKKFSFQVIKDYVNRENSNAKNQSIDKELSEFIRSYESLRFHRESLDDLSKSLKNVNIHYSHLNLIRLFSIFEELDLIDCKKELYGELQGLICCWISERVEGGSGESSLEYLLKIFSKDHYFYQYAANKIINKENEKNDIALSLKNIFEKRTLKYPNNIENQYLMSISVQEWTTYLQSSDAREYIFDDIRWIFISIKKDIFDIQIKNNIFSALDKLGDEDVVLKRYYDVQKKRLLKEAGF
jgi:hypothetical protein